MPRTKWGVRHGPTITGNIFPRLRIKDDYKDAPEPVKRKPPEIDKRWRVRDDSKRKFTDEEVLTIRWIWYFRATRFKVKRKELAAMYGCTDEYLNKLLSGEVRSSMRLIPTEDFVPSLLPAALQAK